MPRGRRKSHVSAGVAGHIRMVRSCSETSNISTDSGAPKIKDCRLSESRNCVGRVISPSSSSSDDDDDDCVDDFGDDGFDVSSSDDLPPPKLYTMAATAPSPTRRSSPSKMKITDYFPPSSPPVLLPEVPLPPSSSSDDQASDRSEGDSGKENEEEPGRELAGGERGPSGRSKDNKSGGVMTRSQKEPVMTRSRAAKKPTPSTGGATKKPFLRLSNTPDGNNGGGRSNNSGGGGGNRNSGQFATPPPSPTKSPQPPRSPPTPHKIKLLDGATSTVSSMHAPPSPASSALQKLKNISFSPKKKSAQSNLSFADNRAASPRKAAAVSPERPMVKVKPDAGPKKPLEANNAVAHPTSANRSKLASKAAAAAAASSHKVTDYFKVRRSGRRPKKTLEKEQLEDYEAHLHVSRDDHLDLDVIEFPEKGRGVVATRNYRKGEFVVEYAGDLIDVSMAKERESKYSLDLSTGCYMYYFKHKGKQYCIDATRETGRIGRLVNHSRVHPNLQTKVVMVKDDPKLILIAKTEVEEGEELLYDYGDRSKESLKAHPWLAL